VPVLCLTYTSTHNSIDIGYVSNITEQIFDRTLDRIQRQYRIGEFDNVTTTAELNFQFSQIFRREASDLTPNTINVNLDMNNLCSDFPFDNTVEPLTIEWDC